MHEDDKSGRASKPFQFLGQKKGYEVALRATMSLPAIFTPVVTADGKVYIDGGLINNLPVDIVKAMGADIMIAIYLETSPFDTKAPQSLFSLSGRAIGVMIAANEKHNMEVADILVTVNLAGYLADDYNKGDKIADQGYEGAEKKLALLSRLAVDGPTWQQYLSQRASRRIRTAPVPQFVEVQGTSLHNANSVEKSLASNVGTQVNTGNLEQDLSRVVGMGRYSSLNYQMIRRDGKDGLLIEGEEKTYAPPMLQPGVFIDGSQYDDILFSVGARLTFLDLGGYRSEWRTDFTLGSTWAVDSEYHRPFSPQSRWFYQPRIFASNSPLDLYSESKRQAQYGISNVGGEFAVGYEVHRNSELRGGTPWAIQRNPFESVTRNCPRQVGGRVQPLSDTLWTLSTTR
jgi:NTE family protein